MAMTIENAMTTTRPARVKALATSAAASMAAASATSGDATNNTGVTLSAPPKSSPCAIAAGSVETQPSSRLAATPSVAPRRSRRAASTKALTAGTACNAPAAAVTDRTSVDEASGTPMNR
jgi:hypothetical protein